MTSLVESQDKVLAYLADPSIHGAPVRRIDTHAASVFLAGDRAFKVKRAVRFPFLDYSTLDKRKAACEAELEVNRRFAPDTYLRVVPITVGSDGSLAIAGKGVAVEWAVEMCRFDETQTLDCLAEERTIDATLADSLGRAVAAAHACAPIVSAEPWVAALLSILEQNTAALRQMPQLFPAEAVAALDNASRRAFRNIEPLLLRRGALGLVRRGHGDLHLGNIVLIEGKPVLFDAIEFDPLIASGDVFYDLAFLLMDLLERELRGAANIVLNRYLELTRRLEDLDGLAALPLFLSLRAAIRAKVTASRLDVTGANEHRKVEAAATRYFQLANDLIAPPPPVLVAIGGLSGTGKSVLARALAPDVGPPPGAVLLRTDAERKALYGVSETERLTREAYEPSVTVRVYQSLLDKAQRVVAAGHSAIVDGVFARAEERAALAQVAEANKVAFRGLFLTADLQARMARVSSRVADVSDADAAVARQQETYALGKIDWSIIDAAGCPAVTLQRAWQAIRNDI